jgi:Flp pilus assembly protein TadD
VRLDSKSPDAYYGRGRVCAAKGDHTKAIADYGRALELDGYDIEALLARGWSYGQSGDYTQALADYRQAIDLEPDHPQAHRRLAHLLATCPVAAFRHGPQAVEHALKAWELAEQEDWALHDTLGAAYAEAEDFEQAATHAQQALALAPEVEQEHCRKQLRRYGSKAASSISEP